MAIFEGPRRWTFVVQYFIQFCLICLPSQSIAQDLNPVLTSTETSIRFEWTVASNASSYQVTWHRSAGIFFFDNFYTTPFDTVDGKLVYEVEGLLSGISYTFLLFQDGNFTDDKVFHGDIATVPQPPEDVEVLNRTSSSVLLTWNPGANSSQHHYEVEYQEDGSIQTVVANTTDDPLTFNLTDLMPGHTYILTMRAVSYGRRSNSSVSVNAVTAPAMPDNLSVRAASTDALTATWEPGNNSLQDSFEVLYNLEGDGTQSTTSCTQSPCNFAVSGEPGQLYTITVFAVKQMFRSEAASVRHNTAPASPRNLTGFGDVRTLHLSWEVPQKGVFDSFRVNLTNPLDTSLTSFDVEKQGDNTTYSFSATDLVGGVNFFVRVFSVTLTEDSKDTVSNFFFTLPESVGSLSGQALNTTAIQLFWQNPINSEFDGLELNVTESEGSTTSYSLSTREETLSVGDLDPGVEYSVVVVVLSKVPVNSAPVNTTVRTKPETPQLTATMSEENSIRVTLTGGDDPNGVFDSIQAKLQEDGTQLTADTDGVIEFLSLTPGTLYTLEAFTMSGTQSSQPLQHTLFTKPRPPQNLTIEVITSEELNIQWEAPDAGGVDNYTVTLVASHGAEVPTVMMVTEQNFSFVDAHPGETYNVTLVANRGTESSEIVMEQITTYPESVAALQKVNATTDSITVNWTAPVSGNFRLFQVGIIPEDSPNSLVSIPVAQVEHTFTELKAGKNYTVGIRTVISRNLFGVVVRLRAVTKPLPVQTLTTETLGSDRLKVMWAVSNQSDQDRFTILKEKDGVRKSYQMGTTEGQSQYEFILDQLLAGHTYSVSVTAIREIDTDIEESSLEEQSGTTNPLPVQNMTVTENNQILTVTWRAATGSLQDTYRVRYRPVLRDPETPWLEQTAVTEATQFPPVFPGEMYEIRVLALSGSQESVPANASVVVAPLAPSISVITDATTVDSITLQWTHDPSTTYVEYWFFTYRDDQSSNSFNESVSGGTNDYTKVLSPLTAGVTYSVEVMAVVQGVLSEMVVANATAKPRINTDIMEVLAETTSTQLTFEYSVIVSDVFDSFRFTLVDVEGQTPVVKSKEDRDHRVTFTGLQGGQVYTVEAVTISAGVISDPKTNNILTVPNNVKVTFQNESSRLIVSFASLEGRATKFVVQCRTPNDASCWDEELASNSSGTTIDNLLPYTTYTIVVRTVSGGGVAVMEKFVEATYNVQTAEAAPSEVRQVMAQEDGLRTVQLSWTQPVALNGELKSYILQYTGTHASGGQDSNQQVGIPPTTTSMRLTDLKAGYTYVFQIQAVTVAPGPAGEKTITLATDVPDFKPGNTAENSKPVKPEQAVITETTMTVQLTNAFSDSNGPILGYTVIVSTDPASVTTRETLPSWTQAQNDGSITAYQATDKCTDLFQKGSLCGKSATRAIRAVGDEDSVMFTLGGQSTADCQTETFCNGPLRAQTDYYVKLRAFTQSGFQETDFSSKIRTADAPKSSSTVIIAVVVSIVVVVIIVVIVAFVIIRLKRRPKRATKYRGAQEATRSSWESSSLKRFSRPVKLRDFPEHVQKMAADSDFKYAEEYEDLKEVGRDQTCHAAELPVNRPKNRFTNILPFDHSRVKLLPTDDEEGSDYINANYMPGYSSKREYVATQGPLPATRDDFWRMVWEQNARNIVMLTRCMEKGREKSDHYWPTDSEPKYYGDLQVVILNETHLPDWTITEFRMCLGDNCRQVRHFHYKAWPDFGVPKNHSSLIRFVRMVREKLIKESAPIITHCSAGVGRSGTFIVLDHCMQLIKEKDEVDIFSIVYSLRRERVLMVQTEQQYKFIHECLACVMEGREDDGTYANVGQINVGFEDDEGINVEVPT